MKRLALFVIAWLTACGGDEPVYTLDRAQLMDPEACRDCHPDHYREWSGSMHAYAGDEPICLAMNARGQRETDGSLGDLCIRCHSPLALQEQATFDGLNMAAVPQKLKGVTCYFCHMMRDSIGPLAEDGVMRGGIVDPLETDAHASAYSPLLDRSKHSSSAACATCHANTYQEWQASLFGNEEQPSQMLSCGRCHSTGRKGLAAKVEGAPTRRIHDHSFAGIDVAITPWPEKEAQLEAIHRDLDPSVLAELCVLPKDLGVSIVVTLDNLLSGHNWPSGVPQNRRSWAEVVAYAGDKVVFEVGRVADNEQLDHADPNLWAFRQWKKDDQGGALHMPWEQGTVTSNVLAAAVTNNPADPAYYHAQEKSYDVTEQIPDRVTLRLRIRPVGLDILDDLVASGDLDPSLPKAMPTHTAAGTVLEWREEMGYGCAAE